MNTENRQSAQEFTVNKIDAVYRHTHHTVYINTKIQYVISCLCKRRYQRDTT